MRHALIVGGHGQDGRLLHQQLETQGMRVSVLARGDCNLSDFDSVKTLFESLQPDEIYYVAAFHHSSQDERSLSELGLFRKSQEVHVTGLVHFLETIRMYSPSTRLFYAASSLIFGDPLTPMQDESTPFNPVCFYGITKAAGVQCCRFYRSTHGLFASCGILYNHESALRQKKFVIPKIIEGALAIASGKETNLRLGNLSARIDWGYAPDYVDAMMRILRHSSPDDFVIATGELHSVHEVVECVFGILGLDWRAHVEESSSILTRKRNTLCGNAGKLREATSWQPTIGFREMLALLLEARRHG